MSDDAAVNAARYIVDRVAAERGEVTPTEAAHERDELKSRASRPTSVDRATFVESQVQQAIRRGDFDDLPGAGKPLPDLGGVHDPDWWIRRKIEREGLRGLGPPALALRVEARELPDRVDALGTEREVREYLEDFNLRVTEARRQLLGGPPVVTSVRDVEEEVAGWRERRDHTRGLRSAAEGDASRNLPSRTPWYRRVTRPRR